MTLSKASRWNVEIIGHPAFSALLDPQSFGSKKEKAGLTFEGHFAAETYLENLDVLASMLTSRDLALVKPLLGVDLMWNLDSESCTATNGFSFELRCLSFLTKEL